MKLEDKLKLFTTKEVAEIFKVSKTQVQNWERQGQIKPIDWGDTVNGHRRRKRFIRYSYDEICRLIDSKK